MIKDPVFLLAYLAGVVGLVFQISRIPRLQGLFDRLPALAVASHPQFVLFGVIVILVHALLTLAAIRVLRAPLFFFGAASQACVGGYSSAPIVAAIYQPSMAPVGLLLAVLGNVMGTYAGLMVSPALSGLA